MEIYIAFVSFSDRFLPDKAIDLIDEAGSRVRLRHAQVFNAEFFRLQTMFAALFLLIVSFGVTAP